MVAREGDLGCRMMSSIYEVHSGIDLNVTKVSAHTGQQYYANK